MFSGGGAFRQVAWSNPCCQGAEVGCRVDRHFLFVPGLLRAERSYARWKAYELFTLAAGLRGLVGWVIGGAAGIELTGLSLENNNMLLGHGLNGLHPDKGMKRHFFADLGFGHFMNQLDGYVGILAPELDENDPAARLQ